jgi:hypothetical protein
MKKCSVCGVKTDRSNFDSSRPIYCFDCDPRNQCTVCGKPRMRPLGHSEYCSVCYDEYRVRNKQVVSNFKIIDKTKVGGMEMNENHYKHLNTRCLDDNGNALSGEAGLNYMKSKGDTYSSRLKNYYK